MLKAACDAAMCLRYAPFVYVDHGLHMVPPVEMSTIALALLSTLKR